MIASEKYRNLSRKELLEKARELGVAYEKNSGSCSQCTAAALREILGFEDVVVKVASSSCGGQAGLSTGACGGVIGGTIVLDYYLGRPADMVSATRTIPDGTPPVIPPRHRTTRPPACNSKSAPLAKRTSSSHGASAPATPAPNMPASGIRPMGQILWIFQRLFPSVPAPFLKSRPTVCGGLPG